MTLTVITVTAMAKLIMYSKYNIFKDFKAVLLLAATRCLRIPRKHQVEQFQNV